MAERMQQPAFSDAYEEDGLDVEDDDSPPGEGFVSGDPTAEFDPSSRPDPRHSHVARRNADSNLLRDGSILGNRYRVESAGQRDGVTVVVRAHHLELGTPATLRYLSPRAARRGDTVSRFLRSTRTAARVHNEHVARVTDIGRFGLGIPFVVTEATEGWTLEEVLRVRGPLAVQEAVEYVVQAGIGIAAAHAAGVVHGAVNPRHLLLSRRLDGSPLLKVEALGVALGPLAEFASDRDVAALESTVPFLSPEQIRDADDIDSRADVWALGAVLHALLSGSPPFHGTTVASVLAAVAADSPIPLTELSNEIAPGLEAAVLQCLAKDRSERFGSVSDLLGALRPFASGDAVAVLDRVPRATRPPPPLPSTVQSVRPTSPSRQSIVPVPRPKIEVEAKPVSPIATAASVGAGVGAVVAIVMALILRIGAPAASPAPAVQAPVALAPVAPVAAPAVATAVPAPVAPVVVPPVVAAPAAVAPVVAAPAVPAAAPVQSKPLLRKPAEAARVDKPTTVIAGTGAKRGGDDLFDDMR